MRLTTPIVYLVTGAVALQGGNPVIGVAVSQGRMEIDRAAVEGNGNLADGATVKSTKWPARIQLTNGNRATLSANSQARVFSDRMVIENGQGLVTAGGYRAEALGFSAMPAVTGAQAALDVRSGSVQVAALNGPVKVTDRAGIVVARVQPGRPLQFEPAATAATGVSTVTGLVRREAGRFYIKDNITNLDVELRGGQVERQLGRRVQVTGPVQASADRESQIVLVSRLSRVASAQDPAQTGGNPQDTGGNRPDTEKPKTGMSNGAKVALVLVIAGGAAGGIIAATSSKKSDSVSR